MLRLICVTLLSLVHVFPSYARGGGHGGSHSHAGGTHSVRGYTKKDGTQVAPHRATNPNGTTKDNFSHKGNVNPDTGKVGTKND